MPETFLKKKSPKPKDVTNELQNPILASRFNRSARRFDYEGDIRVSNIERVENLKQIVKLVQPDFETLAIVHNAVNYKQEASFALQLLNDNYYLSQVAIGDQDSFKRAIINVAAIGLTLNPVKKFAYLVPRDKKVILDISYRGYIQLATEVGAIKWAIAELVYQKDKFRFRGIGKEPVHEFNPFNTERGEFVGGYCTAKTHDGEFIIVYMTKEEIYSIRDRSQSWRAHERDQSKTSPWATDEKEMIKKTLIRRAAKSWPLTNTRTRLDEAIEVETVSDPIDVGTILPEEQADIRAEKLQKLRDSLKIIGRPEEAYVDHLIRTTKRDLKKLEDLTDLELQSAQIFLDQLIENAKTKAKEKSVSEQAS